MAENLQATDLATLEHWLKSTFDPELAPITGFNLEVPNVNVERERFISEACRTLQLLNTESQPIPEALTVIEKYLPDFHFQVSKPDSI